MDPIYSKITKSRNDEKSMVNFYLDNFTVPCPDELSFFTQKTLESCCHKTFYEILEIIQYQLKFNTREREYILQTLYSIAIAIQNSRNASFFDIKIHYINVKKTANFNKFNGFLSEYYYLKIRCCCSPKVPKKKKEPAW